MYYIKNSVSCEENTYKRHILHACTSPLKNVILLTAFIMANLFLIYFRHCMTQPLIDSYFFTIVCNRIHELNCSC